MKVVDYEKTREVLSAFERERVDYVIFGAVALNLQGLARATEDLDIFVAPTEENIRRLRAALTTVFDDPHIQEITAEDLLGDYPAVQYVPPAGDFHVDILTRLGEAFRFEDLESVYLVGGGTHPGSGLPVIFESSRISSRLVLEDMGLDHRWIRADDDRVPGADLVEVS